MTSDIDPKALALRVAFQATFAANLADKSGVPSINIPLSPDEARALAAFLREAVEGWRSDMSGVPQDGKSKVLLGIVRKGQLEEVHIGGWRIETGEDDDGTYDMSCWWSDQADDEIFPNVWMPLTPFSPPPPPARIEDAEEPSHDRR